MQDTVPTWGALTISRTCLLPGPRACALRCGHLSPQEPNKQRDKPRPRLGGTAVAESAVSSVPCAPDAIPTSIPAGFGRN